MALVQVSDDAPRPARRSRPYDGAWREVAAGLLLGGGLLGSLIFWAAASTLPSASIAEGEVVVEGNRRPVQSRDGGTIAAVPVTEGALVHKGDVLVRLDVNELAAQKEILASQLDKALLTRARFEAEASGAREMEIPAELAARPPGGELSSAIGQQRELLAARRDSLAGNVDILTRQFQGLQARNANLKAQIDSTSRQIELTQDELGSFEILLKKGLTEKSRVLALQRQVASLLVDRNGLQADMQSAESQIENTQLQIKQLTKARREEIAAGRAEAEAMITDLTPKLRAAGEQLTRADITAPLDGYVLNLAVHGQGAALAPGQVALEIVPETDALVVKAKIRPGDIEQVREGQSADLHFVVAKAHYQRVISGKLVRISADRKTDPANGQPFYEAVITVDRAGLDAAKLSLLPGMVATAAIITGERTVLQYFLDPILDVASFAMREA